MSDFFLDYDKTYRCMRKHWRILAKHRDVYDEAFQDTMADYVEMREGIPDKMSHTAWFKNRMWHNVNKYEPFRSRYLSKQGYKYDIPVFFSGWRDDEEPQELSAEDELIREEMLAEYTANKWGFPIDTDCEICKMLMQGYSVKEVSDIIGVEWHKDKGKKVYRAIVRAKE